MEILENKLISLLKEVKEIVEKLESDGFKVEITPPYKNFEVVYETELKISKPIVI